jgi:hypothetical protein
VSNLQEWRVIEITPMRAVALLALVPVSVAASGHSARDLLNAARPLTASEIAAILDGSRRAVARKAFRASPGVDAPDCIR